MIINIRGANGSGKTTAVRRVMDAYPHRRPIMTEGRNRPIGYVCTQTPWSEDPSERPLAKDTLFVPGSYENPTGGCDTIRDIETIFELVKIHADAGMNVLFEGIIAQHSKTRLYDLWKVHRNLHVLVLSTSREDCVASVRARRIEKGNTTPLDPSNVEKEYRGVHSGKIALHKLGMSVENHDREAIVARCLELLRVVPRNIITEIQEKTGLSREDAKDVVRGAVYGMGVDQLREKINE